MNQPLQVHMEAAFKLVRYLENAPGQAYYNYLLKALYNSQPYVMLIGALVHKTENHLLVITFY